MEEGKVDAQQPTETNASSSSSGTNFGLIKSPVGLMMIINIILLLIAWVIMVVWRGDVGSLVYENFETEITSFFLFSTITPWILMIILLVVLLLGVHTKIYMINWPLTLLINCCIWAVILIISSSLLADKSDKYACVVWKCDTLRASAAFGFISAVGFLLEGFLHFREFRAA